jgi:hypothetical protein
MSRAALWLGAVMAGLWLIPQIFKPYQPEIVSPAPVSESVDEALLLATDEITRGLGAPLARSEENGVSYAVYQMENPQIDAKEMQGALRKLNIETYVMNMDGLDAELRVYSGEKLKLRYLFTPPLPETIEAPKESKAYKSPIVAIIIAGLGSRDRWKYTRHPLPLTLAVEPHLPFSLRVAEDGAKHWHEIQADLRSIEQKNHLATADIPHATGVLTNRRIRAEKLPRGLINIFPSDGSAADKGRFLSAQYRTRQSTEKTLRRTLQIAASQGRAAILLEEDDPGIEAILAWSLTAADQGFRLAFASEVLRWQSLHGPIE